ncbi:hypothetical protein GCM10022293_27510 [Azospirillum formosense]
MERGFANQRWKKSHAAGGVLPLFCFSATVISVGVMIGLSPLAVERFTPGLNKLEPQGVPNLTIPERTYVASGVPPQPAEAAEAMPRTRDMT